MSVKIQKISDPVTLGEAPHWSDREQVLYFVSFFDNTIHKYSPATRSTTKTKLYGRVGFILPVEGSPGQFVVAVDQKLQVIRWDGQNNSEAIVQKKLGTLDEDKPIARINDGKADPKGRLYTGTVLALEPGVERPKEGSLYNVVGGNITKLDEGIMVSNGLAWDLKEKAFYYIDSMEYNIRRYDYDVETGIVSNMTYVFNFKENDVDGLPNGCTIDTDGNLWVAAFLGHAVLKVDPRTGTLLEKIDMPVGQVTSVTFGGKNHDVLFVTTAAVKNFGETQPLSGATFAVTGLGVKGHPNLSVRV